MAMAEVEDEFEGAPTAAVAVFVDDVPTIVIGRQSHNSSTRHSQQRATRVDHARAAGR